jgi:hypothetical protein
MGSSSRTGTRTGLPRRQQLTKDEMAHSRLDDRLEHSARVDGVVAVVAEEMTAATPAPRLSGEMDHRLAGQQSVQPRALGHRFPPQCRGHDGQLQALLAALIRRGRWLELPLGRRKVAGLSCLVSTDFSGGAYKRITLAYAQHSTMWPYVAASSVSLITNLSQVMRVDKRLISFINSPRTKIPFSVYNNSRVARIDYSEF